MQKKLDVGTTVTHDAESGVGEVRVSIVLDFGSVFHEGDACAALVDRESYYEAGVAAAHDYHIVQSSATGKRD